MKEQSLIDDYHIVVGMTYKFRGQPRRIHSVAPNYILIEDGGVTPFATSHSAFDAWIKLGYISDIKYPTDKDAAAQIEPKPNAITLLEEENKQLKAVIKDLEESLNKAIGIIKTNVIDKS